MRAQTWRETALCRKRDEELYFLDGVPPRKHDAFAREVCYGCRVQSECAQDALDYYDVGVVRAGIAIPVSGNMKATRSLLEFVAAHGHMPETPSDLRPPELFDEWKHCWCYDCHQQLRPVKAQVGMWPGTVPAITKTQCQSCWAKLKRQRVLEEEQAWQAREANLAWIWDRLGMPLTSSDGRSARRRKSTRPKRRHEQRLSA